MASERDRPTKPGYYWCRIDYGNDWSPYHTDYQGEAAEYLTWGPPCLGHPRAEHPDAALRERLGAIVRDMKAAADREANTRQPWGHAPGIDPSAVDDWADDIAALLRTEGQPPHPNPHCPHTLECLCEEDE